MTPGFGDDYDNQNDDDTLDEKKSSDEFARMLEDSFKQAGGKKKRFSVGDKVRGEVLVIGKEEIYVSIGANTDGVISRRDAVDENGQVPFKTGDKVDLFVTQVRGSEIHLSPKPTSKNLAGDIEDAFDRMLPLEGKVAEVCNGGFRVLIKGKLAFCPISQMDNKRIEQPDEYLGKRFEFHVTKFEEGGRNIVVSRRKLLDEERAAGIGTFTSEHKSGDVVPGKVARLEKFGAFVELAPGVDGLAHISELAWSRVGDPSEVLQVGQSVNVKILKIESFEGKLRISLSVKQAGGEPWENLPGQVRPGQVVEGRVTRCVKFGAFVELSPGVEGLIPMAEMSYTKRVVRSDELVKEGDRITVMVKDVDPAGHRISLSLKDAGQDPWALIAQKFPVGAIVPGKVERREPYGLFIRLEEGITGLLPKSKAADRPEFPFEKLKVGDTVTIQIGEIRREERRISLDVPKDPGADDWKGFVASPTQASSGGGFGTLGDKLKAAMGNKKK